MRRGVLAIIVMGLVIWAAGGCGGSSVGTPSPASLPHTPYAFINQALTVVRRHTPMRLAAPQALPAGSTIRTAAEFIVPTMVARPARVTRFPLSAYAVTLWMASGSQWTFGGEQGAPATMSGPVGPMGLLGPTLYDSNMTGIPRIGSYDRVFTAQWPSGLVTANVGHWDINIHGGSVSQNLTVCHAVITALTRQRHLPQTGDGVIAVQVSTSGPSQIDMSWLQGHTTVWFVWGQVGGLAQLPQVILIAASFTPS